MAIEFRDELPETWPPEAQALVRLLSARIAELEARVAELTAKVSGTPR